MLSLRLKSIASLIKKDDRVIDIGCDHAYLSIYLAKQGFKNIIASDINANALNCAINNIKKENLSSQIIPILSDGLKKIDTQNYNTLVISGMGTSTILKILEDKDKLKTIKKIIIQSNNDLYKLRKSMSYEGYIIKQELVVYDKGKYYVIIEFQKGQKKYNYQELMYGPILISSSKNSAYFKYLLTKNESILAKIPKRKIIKRITLKKQNKIIKKILISN